MEAWGSCEFGVIVLSLHPFLFAHFSSLITHYPSLISFRFILYLSPYYSTFITHLSIDFGAKYVFDAVASHGHSCALEELSFNEGAG